MWQFVVRRFGTSIAVMFGVSVITYLMIYLTPGDPAVIILRQQSGEYPSQEAIEAFREQHGLNDPIPVQYLNWMADVLQGDLGRSYYHGTEVPLEDVYHPVYVLDRDRVVQSVLLAEGLDGLLGGVLAALLAQDDYSRIAWGQMDHRVCDDRHPEHDTD